MAISRSTAPAARGERHRVDDEQRPFVVNDVDHFDEPIALPTANHQPLAIAAILRIWATGVVHDALGLFDGNPVLLQLLTVPVDPAKDVHSRT
jgi:hypothetical protein